MKSTKIMLAILATFLITWFVIGTIGYLLSDLSFRDCMTNGATIMIMFIIGWIPASIVGYDLDEYLNS
jgi:lysozyme family protein